MSSAYARLKISLPESAQVWVITGVAGFIGSHLLEELLSQGQSVRGVDNFFSGNRNNLTDVRTRVGEQAWDRFAFFEGDIRDSSILDQVFSGADVVLHQAAVGSVPRSIEDPATSHDVNVNGTFSVLMAAHRARCKRVVYASSSSVYGDEPTLPKVEMRIGEPLSPYALTKRTNELYAQTFTRNFGLETVGLRYFNVFGERQDPHGAYAAVIPRWIAAISEGNHCSIFGDGSNSRDFCYVKNVVQANLLVATEEAGQVSGKVFNVGMNGKITLRQLYERIAEEFPEKERPGAPATLPPRKGDIAHSQADISAIRNAVGYLPEVDFSEGIRRTVEWFRRTR